MEPIAAISQLPDGRVMMRGPKGTDLIWLLGWLERMKTAVHQQIDAQASKAIEVAGPHHGHLLNGVKP